MIIVNSVLLILAVVSRVGEFYNFNCAPLFAVYEEGGKVYVEKKTQFA